MQEPESRKALVPGQPQWAAIVPCNVCKGRRKLIRHYERNGESVVGEEPCPRCVGTGTLVPGQPSPNPGGGYATK